MNYFENLYDETEKVKTRFIGFTTENARYDFGIVYTNMFFGKPIVICMQTNKSMLLSLEDLDDVGYLQRAFSITDSSEAEQLGLFLRYHVPNQPKYIQY